MLAVARWIHFASVFILFGSSFFWVYMRRAARNAGVEDLGRARRATMMLVRGAAPVAAVSGVVWLGGIIANMTGSVAEVADLATLRLFFLDTPFGPISLARLVLMALAVGVGFAPLTAKTCLSALCLIGGLLLVSQAWLGHAAEGGSSLYGAVLVTCYAIHVLAGAAWVGGLPPLAFALAEQRRAGGDGAGVYALLVRFSTMGAVAVSLILISGTANTVFHVGDAVGVLPATPYGAVLFTKLGFVAVMLALAAFNRFAVMPRLHKGLARGPMSPPPSLRASIALECGLGLFVLAAAAVLGITPPPR